MDKVGINQYQNKNIPPKKSIKPDDSKLIINEAKSSKEDQAAVVQISKEAFDKKEQELEQKKELTPTEKAHNIQRKKFGTLKEPGIYFISGFDWLGASSIKGNYDGIRDMAASIDKAEHFSWSDKDKVIQEIKKRTIDQPIILVGHSFGGDSAVEVAQELNTIDNGFRTIDLLVTLDSVGFDNDLIPQNVKKNLNFISQGNVLINDGPNMAINYNRTDVQNFLRPEAHADLDDATDIQIEIIDAINNIV